MKTTITIYRGEKVHAKATVATEKAASEFIRNNMPPMTISEKVSGKWRIFKSYN